jgi:hypothetical protein
MSKSETDDFLLRSVKGNKTQKNDHGDFTELHVQN